MENSTVNGYTLKYKLGEGGMAEVWYAENSLRKPAAVKLLQKRLFHVPEVVSRFENEARLMVQLNHPHIRNVYDFATLDDRPCMIMEYLEGKDLSHRLKDGERFSSQQLITWWNDLVDALQYTHRKNIIHRDIKPSNLFVTEEGQIKVLDFGIAKLRDNISVTQTGSRMGTLLYMSPEQVYDIKNLTYKTDIYSLAVTFFHLVTGQAPYDTTRISDFEVQERIVRKDLDTSRLPEPWRSLLPGYLVKNALERRELQKIGNSASQADQTLIQVAPPATGHTPPQPNPMIRNKPKSQTGSILFGILAVLAVAGLLALALNKNLVSDLFGNRNTPKKAEATIPVTKRTPAQAPAPELKPDTTVSTGAGGTTDQVVTSVDLDAKENTIKEFLNDYYQSRSDCSTLNRFFGDTVKQYYSQTNKPLEQIVKECERYHNKWKFTEANINDATYSFTHSQDGNVFVDFNMLYKIKQNEADDWIPYNIDVSAVVDGQMKITRIVERKIEKL